MTGQHETLFVRVWGPVLRYCAPKVESECLGRGKSLGSLLDISLRGRVLRAFRLRCKRLGYLWHVFRGAVRSARGHIRESSKRGTWCTEYGPALRQNALGDWIPEIRSDSRIERTDSTAATYPWMDQMDRRIFLLGFDAGERWSRDNPEYYTEV